MLIASELPFQGIVEYRLMFNSVACRGRSGIALVIKLSQTEKNSQKGIIKVSVYTEMEMILYAQQLHRGSSENDLTVNSFAQVEEHEMRCLEGLGRWVELNERVKEVKDGLDEKMRVIAARGAWAVGEWTSMER